MCGVRIERVCPILQIHSFSPNSNSSLGLVYQRLVIPGPGFRFEMESFEDTSLSGRKSDHFAYPIPQILGDSIVGRLKNHFGHAAKDLIGPVENSIVQNRVDIVSS